MPPSTAIRLATFAVLLLPSPAQSAPRKPPEQALVDTVLRPEVESRLRSDQPATVAWGAYLAGKYGLVELAPQMLDRLAEQEPRSMVAACLLDGLIRLRVMPTPAQLAPWFSQPLTRNAALVLAARDSGAHADALQRLWRERPPGDLAGMAAGNLLTATRNKAFAAELVRGLRLELRIVVHDPDRMEFDGQGGGMAGGTALRTVPEAFPPVGIYRLDSSGRDGDTVLAGGPHSIYYRRTEAVRAPIRLHPRRATRDRHELAVEWLDEYAPRARRLLSATRSHSVVWVDGADYVRSVETARADFGAAYDALIAALVRGGHVDEALVRPAPIALQVRDVRGDTTEALPPIPPSR